MTKQIFLDNLPKTSKGTNWKNSIGYTVNFIYEDIYGSIIIKKYITSQNSRHNKLLVEYQNKEYEINIDDFKTASFGRICNKITSDFKFNIGNRIVDDIRNLTIINREYRERKRLNGYKEHQKWYYCHCNLCGLDKWILVNHILNGKKCACYNKNNITITARWMIGYFQGGYEEAKLYTKYSDEKIIPKCPHCNKVYSKSISIRSLYLNHGINCSCSDNISYPEKFVISFLEQLSINYEYQKPSKDLFGLDNYYYDFYLPDFNCIIETHGEQHYRTSCGFFTNNKEIVNNDTNKKLLAIKNEINYIVLDCRKSNIEWIKNSLLTSTLKNILNYSEYDINWDKCELYAVNNLIKEVCDFKRANPTMSTSEIARNFPVKRETIGNYLRIGDRLGWCFYNGKNKIIRVYLENIEVGTYRTFNDLIKDIQNKFNIKLCRNMIVNSYKNNISYKGFCFKCLN